MSKLIYGRSIVDRVMSAKHTLTGQEMVKAVYKATTEELMGSKRKHLDYLIMCTNDETVSMFEMCNTLIQRTLSSKWIIVFKALLTIHELMNYGNERFYQHVASTNTTLNAVNFQDRSDGLAFHMSPFIRRYARYINMMTKAYRQLGFDICRQPVNFEFSIEEVGWDKFMSNVKVIKELNDSLLRFEACKKDLTNGVINLAFFCLYKDLLKLFNCYTMHIIKIIDAYFTLDVKKCKIALSLYSEYLFISEDVRTFLKVAEDMGIDKSSMPDLNRAPLDMKSKFEDHLKSIDSTYLKPTQIIGIPRVLSVDDSGMIGDQLFRSKSAKVHQNSNIELPKRMFSLNPAMQKCKENFDFNFNGNNIELPNNETNEDDPLMINSNNLIAETSEEFVASTLEKATNDSDDILQHKFEDNFDFNADGSFETGDVKTKYQSIIKTGNGRNLFHKLELQQQKSLTSSQQQDPSFKPDDPSGIVPDIWQDIKSESNLVDNIPTLLSMVNNSYNQRNVETVNEPIPLEKYPHRQSVTKPPPGFCSYGEILEPQKINSFKSNDATDRKSFITPTSLALSPTNPFLVAPIEVTVKPNIHPNAGMPFVQQNFTDQNFTKIQQLK